MDWLASPLWNLFYLASLVVLLAFAYYSRAETIQKLTLCWFLCYVGTNVVMHTAYQSSGYLLIDTIAMMYTLRMHVHHPKDRAVFIVNALFAAIVVLHLYQRHFGDLQWIVYQIAYNALGMAQLGTLCVFGKSYGRAARCNPADKPRNDPFHSFAMAFAPWLKN